METVSFSCSIVSSGVYSDMYTHTYSSFVSATSMRVLQNFSEWMNPEEIQILIQTHTNDRHHILQLTHLVKCRNIKRGPNVHQLNLHPIFSQVLKENSSMTIITPGSSSFHTKMCHHCSKQAMVANKKTRVLTTSTSR